MTTEKSEAVRFLEKVTGGPLTFGRMIRSLRLCDEESLVEYAEKLGISRQNLSDIEQGRRSVSLERAAEWARILGYGEGQFMELALEQQARAAGLDVEITVTPRPQGHRRARPDLRGGKRAKTGRGRR